MVALTSTVWHTMCVWEMRESSGGRWENKWMIWEPLEHRFLKDADIVLHSALHICEYLIN